MKSYVVSVVAVLAVLAVRAEDRTWTGAVDTDWNTAANWTDEAVPGTSDNALLTNNAGTIQVWVTHSPETAVGSLTVSNVNASGHTTTLTITNAAFGVQAGSVLFGVNSVLDIRDGGAVSYLGEASAAPFFNVRDGGEIRINNGGGLLLTNLYSATGGLNRYMYVGDGSAGTIRIGDGGTFVMGASSAGVATNTLMRLGYNNGGNGLLEMTGDSTFVMPEGNKDTSALYVGSGAGASGTVFLADNAKCLVSNVLWGGSANATGIVSLSGNALLRPFMRARQYGFGNGANAYGELTLHDNAWFDGAGTADQHFYCGKDGGTGRLNVYGGTLQIRNFFHIGFNGTGYFTLTNGLVDAMGQYGRGLTFGVANGNGKVVYANALISGGTLDIKTPPDIYAVEAYSGLQVGKTVAKTVTTTSRVFSEMVQSGGVITNRAYLFIGQGMNATGTVVQTGGSFINGTSDKDSERAFIGSFGGCGSYVLSNGTFSTLKDVYVGGFPDALWPPSLPNAESTNHWNNYAGFYTNKVSTGVLRIDGGSFAASNATIHVGAQGVGTLVIGKDAVCIARDIVLDTNTSSTVRLEFGPDGIGTLCATNSLTVCAGAKLEVDATAYPAATTWTKLIDCTSRTGAFAEADISVIGEGVVRQDRDEDIWLYRVRGTMISVF